MDDAISVAKRGFGRRHVELPHSATPIVLKRAAWHDKWLER